MTPSEFIEAARQTIDETYDVPSKGQGFATSVREKLEAMIETVEETDHVTVPQQRALQNMATGVSKWVW